MTKSLDLGCGPTPKNIFGAQEVYGIDIADGLGEHVLKADLVIEPIPFPDQSFDFVTAHDFIEHVPRVIYAPKRRNPFIELMNEIHRVLKPGGTFLSFTPAYPNPAAFCDPTHVNVITEDTFPLYFGHEKRWAKAYGFTGSFIVRSQEWRGPHLLSLLQRA